MIDLQTPITDIELLRCRTLFREGFAFTSLANIGNPATVFDAIIIRNPEDAQCFSPRLGVSSRTLQNHIDFVNEHQLEKAVVIAESLDFLSNCPSLQYLEVIPADTAIKFDYSPLNDMPNLLGLKCATEYGVHFSQKTTLDYSNLFALMDLDIAGPGHLGISQLSSIRRLNAFGQRPRTLEEMVSCNSLSDLRVTSCAVRSLSGLASAEKLTSLFLWHNRSLSDVSEILSCAETLKSLSIRSCPRITDFSFLGKLYNLEHLELIGNNELPDLRFLSGIKNLRCFVFNMNVLDGDLSYCLPIPYVSSLRNRKHYNYLDSELPKIR